MGKRYAKILSVLFVFSILFCSCVKVDSQDAVSSSEYSAPDFTLGTVDGKSINLKDTLKTKNVVLVFWTTWCPHCVQEVPAVKEYYEKNMSHTAVIGVNIKESPAKVSAFVENNGIRYPVVLDKTAAVAISYGITSIPAVVAINKNGEIIYTGWDISVMAKKIKFQ
jgi:peroxiredoxin